VRYKTGVILFVTVVFSIIAFMNTTPEIAEIQVSLKNLPKTADGFTMVHLSDVHIGAVAGLSFLRDIVRKVNSLHPDIIVITGNFFDYTYSPYFKPQADELAILKSKYGVFFVTGSSEYAGGGAESWGRVFNYLNWRTLKNDVLQIVKDNETIFEIGGVDDWNSGYFYSMWGMHPGPKFSNILKKRLHENKPLIFLAHNPAHYYEAYGHVDLQLSGHTMGGQMFPMHFLVYPFYRYFAGYYHEEKSSIFVSQGAGSWGPPMRLLSDPEITRIILRAKESELVKKKEEL